MPVAQGTRLGPYEIVGLLGAGGMGEVYRAQDTRLGRPVAVKVLPPSVCRDPGRLHRFEQEAKAEGQLNHPNVVIVHDIGTHEGTPYIVTELLEGESLRERLKRGPLPVPQAVPIALKIARGLAAAHAKGIVHRDLKPDNVFLTPGDGVKILDFGVAKLLDTCWPAGPLDTAHRAALAESETQAHLAVTGFGAIVGTPAYMSPEQASGGHVDFRSDLFSFGIVLYEMLTGKDPFQRGTAADTLSAILREKPPQAQANGRRTPVELDRVLQRTLAKEPSARYGSSEELVCDLERLAGRLERRIVTPLRVAAAAAILVAILVPAWVASRRPAAPPKERPPVSLLVADLENRTGDPVFDGALEQALQIGLEGAPFVTAYSRPAARRVAGRIEASAAERLDERVARLVCGSEGVALAVVGTLSPDGGGYRLEVRAVDAVKGEAAAQAAGRAKGKADVLVAVTRVAEELRRQLGDTQPTAGGARAPETFTTASLDAMARYAGAQELQYAGRYAEARARYDEALAIDANMGRAYSGKAVVLANLGEPEEAQKQFEKALSLVDRMTERERGRTLGAYYLARRQPRAAVEEFERLVSAYPADSAGRANLALAYFLDGRLPRALDEGRAALRLSPRNVPQRNNVAWYAMYAGDFETALKESAEVLALNAGYEKAYVVRALSELASGRVERTAQEYERLRRVSPRGASMACMGLADLALYQGRTADAAALLQAGAAEDERAGNPSARARKLTALAEALLALGRRPEAVATASAALAVSRQPSVAYPAALVLLAGDKEPAARETAKRLGSELQPEARAYGALIEGEILLVHAQPREALARFEQATTLADTWLGRVALARAQLQAGAFPEAYSTLQLCVKRRGEAVAAFLDDVPTARHFVPVYYHLGRVQEAMGSSAARDSYRTFLNARSGAAPDALLVRDARERLDGIEP